MTDTRETDRVPLSIFSLGVVLGLVVLAETLAGVSGVRSFPTTFAVGVASSLPFIVAIAYGGYWLSRTALSPDRYGRIGGWCFGGVGGFLLFNVLLMMGVRFDTPVVDGLFDVIAWLRWAASLGGGIGLLVGIFEARAIEREVAAEHATVRAEVADARRELLDYLNSLLRHEVLNTANVIEGYTLLLQEDADDPDASDRLEIIHRQAKDLTRVIQDVRVLLDATRGAGVLQPIDLSGAVTREVTRLRDTAPTLEVDAAIPEGVYVAADSLLPRIFSNLLVNAVEHNDSETPVVSVSVERRGETARVRIEDNGPGIPEDERDGLFEHESTDSVDHGLGLSLVATLVDRYDGEIELAETGPEGSVFTVTFPRIELDYADGSSVEAGPDRSTGARRV